MSSKKFTTDNDFRDRLKFLIKEKLFIKQSELADKLGISKGYLSMFLNGSRGPSAELIAGLFLNYSEHLYWLLTGIGFEKINSINPKKSEVLEKVSKIIDNGNIKSINKLHYCIDEIQDFESLRDEIEKLKSKS